MFVTIYIAGDQLVIVEHRHNLHEQTDFAVLPVKLAEFKRCTSY